MKWLVVLNKEIDREKALEQLRSLCCQVLGSDRGQPLGANEEVLLVEGPANLAQLAAPFSNMMAVYPNSKMSAY